MFHFFSSSPANWIIDRKNRVLFILQSFLFSIRYFWKDLDIWRPFLDTLSRKTDDPRTFSTHSRIHDQAFRKNEWSDGLTALFWVGLSVFVERQETSWFACTLELERDPYYWFACIARKLSLVVYASVEDWKDLTRQGLITHTRTKDFSLFFEE